MATLRVTFGRISGLGGTSIPLEDASSGRTQDITIPGSTDGQALSDVQAQGGETVLTVYADDDCYFAVGGNPNAEQGENRRFLASGKEKQFAVAAGQKVAVIGA